MNVILNERKIEIETQQKSIELKNANRWCIAVRKNGCIVIDDKLGWNRSNVSY